MEDSYVPKIKSDIATWIGLIVKLRPQLLRPSNTVV
jgi:hypothetical protein